MRGHWGHPSRAVALHRHPASRADAEALGGCGGMVARVAGAGAEHEARRGSRRPMHVDADALGRSRRAWALIVCGGSFRRGDGDGRRCAGWSRWASRACRGGRRQLRGARNLRGHRGQGSGRCTRGRWCSLRTGSREHLTPRSPRGGRSADALKRRGPCVDRPFRRRVGRALYRAEGGRSARGISTRRVIALGRDGRRHRRTALRSGSPSPSPKPAWRRCSGVRDGLPPGPHRCRWVAPSPSPKPAWGAARAARAKAPRPSDQRVAVLMPVATACSCSAKLCLSC